MADLSKKLSSKTTSGIFRAAVRLFGRRGYRGASMDDVAQEAGIDQRTLRGFFHTKEMLLIETQRATFRRLHRRFSERANRGERGIPSALDALDAMWLSVRDLREGAPFIVETLSLAGKEEGLRKKMRDFYQESTQLLTDGISNVFSEDLDILTIPPQRMAVLIRILLEGLAVELAQARTTKDLAEIDQAYADLRELFARFVITGKRIETPIPDIGDSIPLPW